LPQTDDCEIYLILNDYGAQGRAWAEIDEARANREYVIRELIEGQYSGPVRIVAFNTAERWSRDASEEIADEVSKRLALRDQTASAGVEDFIARHGQFRPFQLPLPLRGVA
jgi:hypothetical protein